MSSTQGLRFYEFPRTRSARCRWTLQELRLPFEAIRVELPRGEHLSPEYRRINPFGRVPALQDGELVLFESVAICLHLAAREPDGRLLPEEGTARRSRHDQWLFFTTNELEQPLWRICRHTVLYPEVRRLPADVELAREDFRAAAAVLEEELRDGRGFIVGDDLTVADIVLGYTLRWAIWSGLLDDFPSLVAYHDRLAERPAYPAELRA